MPGCGEDGQPRSLAGGPWMRQEGRPHHSAGNVGPGPPMVSGSLSCSSAGHIPAPEPWHVSHPSHPTSAPAANKQAMGSWLGRGHGMLLFSATGMSSRVWGGGGRRGTSPTCPVRGPQKAPTSAQSRCGQGWGRGPTAPPGSPPGPPKTHPHSLPQAHVPRNTQTPPSTHKDTQTYTGPHTPPQTHTECAAPSAPALPRTDWGHRGQTKIRRLEPHL